MTLALTLSEKSVSIGMVQVLGRRQAANKAVPVTVVVAGTLDLFNRQRLAQMKHLITSRQPRPTWVKWVISWRTVVC